MSNKSIINVIFLGVLFMSMNIYAEKKEIITGVALDFLDTAYYLKKGDYVSKEELRERIRKLSDMGIKKFYFRACTGFAYYPSKLLRKFTGDGRSVVWDKRLTTSINKYDVLGEVVKLCKEFNMKIYYWEPLFDSQATVLSWPPNSEKRKKFGKYPMEDRYFEKNEGLYMKHRYADKFSKGDKLDKPIGKIKLYNMVSSKPRLTKKDIKIYVGNAKNKPPLRRYEKDFSFSIIKENRKYVIVLDKLDITDKIIKINQVYKDKKYTFAMDFTSSGWGEFFDCNGNKMKLIISGEPTRRDNDLLHLITGVGAQKGAWDYNGRSILMHIGAFDKYAGGMPCYALRKARDRRLEIAKEILTNYPGIDGIAYSMRSHSAIKSGTMHGPVQIAFGYNDVIVNAYKKRYGKNILKEDFNVKKFLSLRGDFFTEFIGEAAKLVHSFGKKLEVQAIPDSKKINYGYNHLWNGYTINDFFQIDKWAKKGYVDTVMLLSNNPKWDPEWNNQIKIFHDRLKGTKTKLAFVFQIREENKGRATLPFIKQIVKNEFIDEVVFYEEETIFKRNLYNDIASIIKQANLSRTTEKLKK